MNGIDYLGSTWFGTTSRWMGVGAAVLGGIAAVAGAPIAVPLLLSAAIWGLASIIDAWLDPDDGRWDPPDEPVDLVDCEEGYDCPGDQCYRRS